MLNLMLMMPVFTCLYPKSSMDAISHACLQDCKVRGVNLVVQLILTCFDDFQHSLPLLAESKRLLEEGIQRALGNPAGHAILAICSCAADPCAILKRHPSSHRVRSACGDHTCCQKRKDL